MRAFVWAFLDRLAPRAGTALLMLAFAAVSSPSVVGYYAAVMTGYAILQAVSDGAAKRIATAAVATESGLRFLARYRRYYAFLGTFFLLTVLVVVRLWGAPWPVVVSMLPIVVLPPIMGRTIEPLAHLQRAGLWRRISTTSMFATFASLSVAFPLVFWLHSPLGSITQLVLTESIFMVGTSVLARKHVPVAPPTDDPRSFARDFRAASTFILTLQGQYQLDRVVVGALAGPATLGHFNLGWSLSRSVTDALSTSSLSVVQSRVFNAVNTSRRAVRSIIMSALLRTSIMSLGVVFAVYFGARFIAPQVLDPSWHEMLAVVPLMSASAIPGIVVYCLLPALLRYHRMGWAIWPRIGGLVLSVGVGWAVLHSLEAAVWIVLVRECVSMAFVFWGARTIVDWRMVMVPVMFTFVAYLVVVGLDRLLAIA